MLPVLFIGGLTGAFLHPLALSYVLAVIASMRRRAHRHARRSGSSCTARAAAGAGASRRRAARGAPATTAGSRG